MGFFFFFIPNAKTNVVIFFVKIRYFIQTTSFFFRIHMEYIIFLQERKFRVEFHYICEGTRRKSGSYNIANNVHSRSNLHKMILIKPYTYIYIQSLDKYVFHQLTVFVLFVINTENGL